MDMTAVDILASGYTFRATGSIIKFDGFMVLYLEGKDDGEEEEAVGVLPEMKKGESLSLKELLPTQHFTQAPARYTEASLVKELEQKGIGRPSTYAPIIATVTDRGYVHKEGRVLAPTELGEIINQQLVEHFPKIVDVLFTAHMEDDLDDILEGKVKWRKMLADFWEPFAAALEAAKVNMKTIKKEEVLEEKCPECGKQLMVRAGRYGDFIACSGFPECRYTRPLEPTGPEAEKVEAAEPCEKCGKPMVKKRSRFGEFWACSGYPECKNIRSIVRPVGVKCPQCGGDLVERRSKRGKTFFGCKNYPKCKFGLWSRPTGDKCPRCGALMVEKYGKGKVTGSRCSNKECGFVPEQDSGGTSDV